MSEFSIGIIADWLKLPFEESLKACAEMGADGVQLYAVSGEMAPENLTPAQIAEKKALLSRYGLTVSALCGDLGGHGFARKDENPEKIEKSKRIVDLALALDSRVVTTHIGVVPEDDTCDTYKILQEACNELAEYAHQNGAFFAIETGPEPAERLRKFLDSLDSKGVAVNLDPANLVMVTGDDPVKAVHNLKDYIVHTHAKDGKMLAKGNPEYIYGVVHPVPVEFQGIRYFEEVPLGTGQVDYPAYLAALDEIGYRGYLTIEREVGDSPEKDITTAANFLREIINK